MYASDVKHTAPSLQEKLRALYSLNRDKVIDLSFRPPYLELLQAFGNPHLKPPPAIHVAGTNGKGSTIAFMRAILEAAGYKVHVYTSPHLCAFNERIVLAGRTIDDKSLEVLIDEALALGGDKDLTFFEITTAMAFAAFSRIPADILLLEVGLGGRLDCTNIIEKPLASVITSIAFDHMEHLGETLEQIAAEKAGIMKEGAPCVIGAQNKDAIDEGIINVFESKAESLGVPLLCYDADWLIEKEQNQICFSFAGAEFFLPLPTLTGPHQIQNLGAALAALKAVETLFPVAKEAYAAGIRDAFWPARLQRIENGPLAATLKNGWELWLDGGHNESAAQALAQQAEEWRRQQPKNLHLVLGMMKHKDPAAFIAPLLPYIASVTVIDIAGEPAAFSAETLAKILAHAAPALKMYKSSSPLQTIKSLCADHGEQGRVLIAGSLYLAGHVLKETQIAP